MQYTVTYDANGGTGSVPTDSNEYAEGATVTVDFATVPTKDGYTFLGWAITSDATAATYTSTGTTTFAMGTADVTLYAMWEATEINWTELVADLEVNPSTYLTKAQALGQTSTAAVALGTDGEVVNLDMWQYYETDDGEGMSLGDALGSDSNYGYDPQYIIGGKIIGTVPQYIYVFGNYYEGNYIEINKVYPVTKMDGTFNYSCYYDGEQDKMEVAPEIPTTVTALESTFFYCHNLTNVSIPESVTSIGVYAFGGCISLSSINIPGSVTSIGYEAFRGCTSLSSVNMPNVESIEDYAFSSCTNLSSVSMPNVTSIGEGAFRNCTGLSSINIPESVTTIGEGAFYSWTESQTINCEILEDDKPSGWNAKWDYYSYSTARKATLKWGVSM